MKELFEEMTKLWEEVQAEATAQIEKGNKAAGGRARKATLALGKKLGEFRKASIEASKTEKKA